ncbi:hypothetical protein ACFV2Q_27360 [Streptomyces sp. NPDC059650]|uniref:hypothetical protein n=1 Tax=Streptomyces sp. NPDC059650 TaxID=3346896 RepID=UPI0036AB4D24
MKLWPFKTMRTSTYDDLVATEGALTVALDETVAMEKDRDEARAERDEARAVAQRFHRELEEKAREVQRLLLQLSQAEHGAGGVSVLLDNGKAVTAHRTEGGARRAARERYGVDEGSWGSDPGRSVTEGLVISTIPLVAEADDTNAEVVTV